MVMIMILHLIDWKGKYYFKTLLALKIAASATPTSAKTASHIVATPIAPKIIDLLRNSR
jgi:hypothetical protein